MARESPAVVRARRKLQQQLEEEKGHFTPGSIHAALSRLHRQQERHQPEREKLQNRNIVIGSENKYIQTLAVRLKKALAATIVPGPTHPSH